MNYFINKKKVTQEEAYQALEKYDKVLLERNGDTVILNIRAIRDEEIRIEREKEEKEKKELAEKYNFILGWYCATNYASDSGEYFYYMVDKNEKITDEMLRSIEINLWERGYEDVVSNLEDDEDEEEESENIENYAKIVSFEELMETMNSQFGYRKPELLKGEK